MADELRPLDRVAPCADPGRLAQTAGGGPPDLQERRGCGTITLQNRFRGSRADIPKAKAKTMVRKWHKEILRAGWDGLRTSFWFLPVILMTLGAVLAVLAAQVEGQEMPSPLAGVLFGGEPDAGRDVLTTLLAAMVTMTSLVFSITMVVLTLAASQFGPRLIRNFMRDWKSQVVLGTFAATIIVCLLTLAMLDPRQFGRGGHVGVTLTIALALLNVVLLVLYHHLLARSIMSETVIRRVGAELDALIRSLGPAGTAQEDPEEAKDPEMERSALRIGPGASGYVQAVEFDSIVAAAKDADAVVGLYFRAGDYVIADGPGIAVFPADSATAALCRTVRQALSIGAHRTPVQDVEFSIRHLVEIALRALSPSLNDPYTAISVIDQLSASLAMLMGRAMPPGVYRDAEGAVRVLCRTSDHAAMIGVALNQIRQASEDKPIVLLHLLQAIGRLAPHARTASQSAALDAHLELVRAAAERGVRDPTDQDTVRRAYRRAKDAGSA
jgi:uncharacterized membrane protein